MKTKLTKEYILIIVLVLIIGILSGYYLGIYYTIQKVVDISSRFIDANISQELVHDALFRYNNNIGACFPKMWNITI